MISCTVLMCVLLQKVALGADSSLVRTISRCILFDGGNISFEVSLVIYKNNTNIPPIMIIEAC
jgi:hypothetical protein